MENKISGTEKRRESLIELINDMPDFAIDWTYGFMFKLYENEAPIWHDLAKMRKEEAAENG